MVPQVLRTFYYYPEYNIFRDETDQVVFNIYDFVTPNDIYLFKFLKRNRFVLPSRQFDCIVRLLYPIHEKVFHIKKGEHTYE